MQSSQCWLWIWRRGCVALLAATALSVGCETTQQANGTLETAVQDYEASRYASAHEHAVRAMRENGAIRHEAAYLAGLSAFRLDNRAEAELRFRTASRSEDAELAARANAMLGQIRLKQGRPREAARLFESASRDLTGNDARVAGQYAAIAHREAGDHYSAERWERQGVGSGSGTQHHDASGIFAIQVGAFNERARAEQAVRNARSFAERENHGEVRIVRTEDHRGRSLYIVQFGAFDTRASAVRARDRLGRLDYIVAPTATATPSPVAR